MIIREKETWWNTNWWCVCSKIWLWWWLNMFKMTMRSWTSYTGKKWTWNITKIVGRRKHDLSTTIEKEQTAVMMTVDKWNHSIVLSTSEFFYINPLFVIYKHNWMNHWTVNYFCSQSYLHFVYDQRKKNLSEIKEANLSDICWKRLKERNQIA